MPLDKVAIFKSIKCAYIINPKVANNSIQYSLGIKDNWPELNQNRNLSFSEMVKTSYNHRIQISELLSDNKYNDWIKFSFVRNPFDKLVSCWYDKCISTNYFKEKYNLEFKNFLDFVKYINTINLDQMDAHCSPQYLILFNKKNFTPIFNFIGKYENLTKDWESLNKLLGIFPTLLLGNYNKKNKNLYSEYYCKQSIEIVKRTYQKDFELFNYCDTIKL